MPVTRQFCIAVVVVNLQSSLFLIVVGVSFFFFLCGLMMRLQIHQLYLPRRRALSFLLLFPFFASFFGLTPFPTHNLP